MENDNCQEQDMSNHWSSWGAPAQNLCGMPKSGECIVPIMTEKERARRTEILERIRIALDVPAFDSTAHVEDREIDATAIAAGIVEALRADRFPRA